MFSKFFLTVKILLERRFRNTDWGRPLTHPLLPTKKLQKQLEEFKNASTIVIVTGRRGGGRMHKYTRNLKPAEFFLTFYSNLVYKPSQVAILHIKKPEQHPLLCKQVNQVMQIPLPQLQFYAS